MIAQLILSLLLCGVLVYAWVEARRSPVVAVLALAAGLAGLYFVWFPSHSTLVAELAGIGRGVDLILYLWVCISLIVLLNLHLKLRTQHELITALARQIALASAQARAAQDRKPVSPENPALNDPRAAHQRDFEEGAEPRSKQTNGHRA